MTIYRDLISHDEMFSRHLCLEEWGGWSGGQRVTLMTGSLVEMPPLKAQRAKEPKETSFTKEAYKKAIKDYMKSVKGKFEEQRPKGVKPFTTRTAEQIKHILADFKHY
ncbi:hypothetical protein E5288_WYG011082 [Bos mutus]|uniref:Translationally-controlled tumor protein n=1 Tax=Bos mutus TaxID=72004 RepID=A0A6B0R025_9CETA|nr:hypothetical protein [Bos mutus]